MTDTPAASTGTEPLPQHVQKNRAHWDDLARTYVASGERHWAAGDPTWGIWNVSESDVRMLPADLDGKDVIALDCGTAYVSAWVARRGARVVGIDKSGR
jgi:2-polyprenyl-3-methyl-5-hydroxy-6-metoxy-1,4-benzoquinol methylase